LLHNILSVGGHVVDRIIRHGVAEPVITQQQQRDQKQKPKGPAKPKTDTEEPKTLAAATEMAKRGRGRPLKKVRKHKKVKVADQQERCPQVMEKKQGDEAVISEEAAMAEQTPLQEVGIMDERITVDQLMMEGDKPGGSDMAAIVEAKKVVRKAPPESPRAKESLGVSLMKVSDRVLCAREMVNHNIANKH